MVYYPNNRVCKGEMIMTGYTGAMTCGTMLLMSVSSPVYIFAAVLAIMVGGTIMIKDGMRRIIGIQDRTIAAKCENKEYIYKKSTLFLSCFEIFILPWLMLPGVLLIPGNGAWLVFFPIMVIAIVVEVSAAKVLGNCGVRRGRYWLMHLTVAVIGITAAVVLRSTVLA